MATNQGNNPKPPTSVEIDLSKIRRVAPVIARSLFLTHPLHWMRSKGLPLFGRDWFKVNHVPAQAVFSAHPPKPTPGHPALPVVAQPTISQLRARHAAGLDPGMSLVLHRTLQRLPEADQRDLLNKSPEEVLQHLRRPHEDPPPTDAF